MSTVENPETTKTSTVKRQKRGVPEGLWLRCDGCGGTVFRKQVEQNLNVCPECDHHFYVPTSMRIRQLLDPDSFEEWWADMTSGDPLGFADRKSYKERVVDEEKIRVVRSKAEKALDFVGFFTRERGGIRRVERLVVR